LTGIDTGIILLHTKDKLEKIFSSRVSEKIKISKQDKIYKVLMARKIIIVRKNETKKFDFLKKVSVRDAIFIPLVYHHEPLGIVVLLSEKEISLSKKDIALLQLFSSTVGIAMKKTQLHAETQNALEMRDSFISLASHELRTPLTSLSGYVQLLYKKLAQKNTQESRWVEQLYEENTRLTHSIKELLDINRIKQGQLEFILREVNVEEVVEKAIERFHLVNSENEIFFSNGIKTNQGRIIGDFDKLLQMVSALLSNAAKFSKPRSKIQVVLSRTNRFVVLKIKDQGEGIPNKEINKIFTGFYKIGKDEKEGMGVGLLFAKHVIEHHHGKIEITSKEKNGTIMEVQLPIVRYKS
jgi:K+-sensing histidine kinase KdpD